MRSNIMESGAFAKFWDPHPSTTNGEDLLRKLMDTGEHELVFSVEGDKTWGIGYRPGDAAKCRDNWGQNMFGKALMGARSTCRNYLQHRVTLGRIPSCPAELMFRRALKDGKLNVILKACGTGEINVLSRMAAATRDPGGSRKLLHFWCL